MPDWKSATDADPSETWGSAIFAEDVRLELGGTFSLIGMMPGAPVEFEDFPARLHKLAVLSLFTFANPPQGVALRVDLPGGDKDKPFWSEELPTPPEAITRPAPAKKKKRTLRKAYHLAILEEIELAEPGNIQVSALVGGSIIPMGVLSIVRADPEEDA